MNTRSSRLLREFANTVREWHYLMGGLAVGFLVGAEYARRYHETRTT